MRIGPFSNGLAIQKFDKIQQRAIVQKHIPQYIQIMYYDLSYPNPTTLHVEGTIVGTSTNDLATKMQQFIAVVRQKKVVWIDASDSYPGRLDLVRIVKRQGPTVEYTQGVLSATFQIDAQILPPWGYTHTNPWRQDGIFFRDLNSVGREYAINPLMNHCNFQMNESSQPYSFSWEFIVDNQNPFTKATSLQEFSCDSLTSLTTNFAGGLTGIATTAIDTTNFKEGASSLKGTQSSPAASTYYAMGYDLGSSGVDFSSYDRYRAWFRCDQSGQQQYDIFMQDASGRRRDWTFALQAANTWMNVEVNIASYSDEASGFDITHVRYFGCFVLMVSASPPSSINIWIDDIRVETGYVTLCEDTSGWTASFGCSATFSNDTTILKEGKASLKASGVTAGQYGPLVSYQMPVGSFDLTQYDFIVFWFRSDFSGNASGNLTLGLRSGSSPGGQPAQFWGWTLNANQWYRLVAPLRNPSGYQTSTDVSAATNFNFQLSNNGGNNATMWIDEIAVDNGLWTTLEFNIPDNLSPSVAVNVVEWDTWNGSSYQFAQGFVPSGQVNASPYRYPGGGGAGFLDGSLIANIYTGSSAHGSNGYGITVWENGTVGTAAPTNYGPVSGSPQSLIYTQTYGSMARIGYSIKLPPATSDSLSGNYPSNDVSGFQAINKVRLKVTVYFSNDDTTYSGM